jgi:hypothetical protein
MNFAPPKAFCLGNLRGSQWGPMRELGYKLMSEEHGPAAPAPALLNRKAA